MEKITSSIEIPKGLFLSVVNANRQADIPLTAHQGKQVQAGQIAPVRAIIRPFFIAKFAEAMRSEGIDCPDYVLDVAVNMADAQGWPFFATIGLFQDLVQYLLNHPEALQRKV